VVFLLAAMSTRVARRRSGRIMPMPCRTPSSQPQ
jgi:hypothetical protein